MCPQLYQTYRAPASVQTEPELRIRGAANRVDATQGDVVESSDDDLPPPLEPIDATQGDMAESSDDDLPPPLEPIDPPLRVPDRVAITPSRAFTIYRAQGVDTSEAAPNPEIESSNGRRSRLGSHWSESDPDDEAAPRYLPAPTFSLPWSRAGLGTVTCLEQYLVIVVDGERLFFRVSIRVERTSRGFQPSVAVDFMNYVPTQRTFQNDVWLLFAAQLEATLLREVDRAFRRVWARPVGTRF